MDILTIAVLPENRGRGIGRELLARAENEARAGGVSLAILDVATDNLAATALYRQAGYRHLTTRKAYYRRAKGRVDALVMQKWL
ncbi:MAG TPA: GNAT family N-acetyltransferase [Hellea balneolensis]|uniref:GNAT family N-acetyltransferase n=1 Tax=Hellea balneolensis TaxID=287478 RepID=A0A7C5QQD9_9PROT|nr:GNAT family N-acetyltransferase [Hellea balneolensis]